MEPVWVRDDVVLAIHQRQLAEHGGAAGVRDEGLLESGLAKPRQLLAYGGDDVDLADLAAAYALGLLRNHPFVDGNKRTAYVVCRTFLLLNGFDLQASAEEKYLTFWNAAAGELADGELTQWIRSRMATSGI